MWSSISLCFFVIQIPLPDVFKTSQDDDENTALWERLKQETGLYLTDTPADGIYRVPRTSSLCGWWLCWKTHRVSHIDSNGHEETNTGEKNKLWNIEQDDKEVKKRRHRQSAKLVLQRTCTFVPKSMWDIIATMMDFSLLKNKSFAIILITSLIATMGERPLLHFSSWLSSNFMYHSAMCLHVMGNKSLLYSEHIRL